MIIISGIIVLQNDLCACVNSQEPTRNSDCGSDTRLGVGHQFIPIQWRRGYRKSPERPETSIDLLMQINTPISHNALYTSLPPGGAH